MKLTAANSIRPMNSDEDSGAGGMRGSVLLADGSAGRRAALGRILRDEGFTVIECTSASDVIPLAKERRPDVCFLDAGIKRLDAGECVRVLERFEGTRSVVVIVTCPPEIESAQLARLEATGALLVLVRPLTREGLLQAFRQALDESRHRKAKQQRSDDRKEDVTTRHCETNNSLLVRRLECPFHETPVSLDHFVLRTGKILTDASFFDLPVYKSAVSGADFVDYHLLGVAVCPRCLFASNNPEHFADPGNHKAKTGVHPPATKRVVAEAAGARLQMAGELPQDFFSPYRSVASAIVSYELAIASSKTLLARDRHAHAFELLRLGNYHLRLAYLHDLNGAGENAQRTQYAGATGWLREAFTVLDGAPLYKATYQLVAIGLASGDDRGAYQYLTRLAELQRQPVDAVPDRPALDRYLARCRLAWEDRDHHRFPWNSSTATSDVAAAA
jgi:DNA-binding response OmpR family regulator